jgi:hypothetical protein
VADCLSDGGDGKGECGAGHAAGINAHVQNDMSFVLAALSLRNQRGVSRKPDHDMFNVVLKHA